MAEEEKKCDDATVATDAAVASDGPLLPSPAKVLPSFTAPYGPNVHVSAHPVLSHKLSVLRSSSTSPSSFRAVLREITFHLGYEATATLTTREVPITVPPAKKCRGDGNDHIDATGYKVKERVALIPIMRSGLGMVEPMLELVNDAAVHHIGMYRTKSLMPVQYYNRLPRECGVDAAYVLDPLIATSNTVISVVGMLKKVRSEKQKRPRKKVVRVVSGVGPGDGAPN